MREIYEIRSEKAILNTYDNINEIQTMALYKSCERLSDAFSELSTVLNFGSLKRTTILHGWKSERSSANQPGGLSSQNIFGSKDNDKSVDELLDGDGEKSSDNLQFLNDAGAED